MIANVQESHLVRRREVQGRMSGRNFGHALEDGSYAALEVTRMTNGVTVLWLTVRVGASPQAFVFAEPEMIEKGLPDQNEIGLPCQTGNRPVEWNNDTHVPCDESPLFRILDAASTTNPVQNVGHVLFRSAKGREMRMNANTRKKMTYALMVVE